MDFIGRPFLENFQNSCLRRWLSPTLKQIGDLHHIHTICQFLVDMQKHEGRLGLPSPVVEGRYRSLLALKAEKERSLTALVAGMTSISLPRVQISLSRILRAFPSD